MKGRQMPGWSDDIEAQTLANENFRAVLFTGAHLQLTVMNLAPGEEIGREVHDELDQFIRIESGRARVELGPSEEEITETLELEDDHAVVIPGGTWHNVINSGPQPLKLYSIYSPPEHPDGTVHRTKAEADAAEHAH
jgi:mannose-6-phosphate isomerase-like protein (cupin superfamily)